jgi:hypothetical protein
MCLQHFRWQIVLDFSLINNHFINLKPFKIMPLPTLTPSNVAAKLVTLYALPKVQLEVEAAAVQFDFRGWVDDNFALTPAQSAYMTGMNDRAVQYYGMQCSLCFRNKLDIILVYPAPPAIGYDGGKWIEDKNDLVVTTSDNGAIEVTGTVTFTVIYRP